MTDEEFLALRDGQIDREKENNREDIKIVEDVDCWFESR